MHEIYFLLYDETRGLLSISSQNTESARVLETFSAYDDAVDVLQDIRALCSDGVSVHDVVEATYGVAQDVDELGSDSVSVSISDFMFLG